MAPQLVGRQSRAFILPQSAAGTAASGDHQPFGYYALTPRRNDPLEDDPIIDAGLHNVMDNQAPAEGLIDAGVDLDVPLSFTELGLFLPHLFNAAAPSGSDPYDHVFTSGQREPAGASIAWIDGDEWQRAHTWTPSRMEIGVAQESGRRRVRFSGMASDIDEEISDPTGTPLSALAASIMPAGPGAVVRYDGTVMANLVGGSVFYERQLEAHRPAGRADRTALEFTPQVPGRAGGDLRLRIKDRAFYKIARSKDAAPVEIEYSLSPSAKLVLAFAAVRLVPAERPIEGPGPRTENYTMRAEQTGAAPMLTATLTNGVASYPAAA